MSPTNLLARHQAMKSLATYLVVGPVESQRSMSTCDRSSSSTPRCCSHSRSWSAARILERAHFAPPSVSRLRSAFHLTRRSTLHVAKGLIISACLALASAKTSSSHGASLSILGLCLGSKSIATRSSRKWSSCLERSCWSNASWLNSSSPADICKSRSRTRGRRIHPNMDLGSGTSSNASLSGSSLPPSEGSPNNCESRSSSTHLVQSPTSYGRQDSPHLVHGVLWVRS